MENLLEKIIDASSYLKHLGFQHAKNAIVLGTGLGSLIRHLEIEKVISYKEIPHFPLSTVESHKGQLILGHIGTHRCLVMQGRFHYYEGYSMQQITFPIRVLKELGVENLLLSNAAGGMNPDLEKGDLALITDHINLLPENPLRGINNPAFGNRFVDMSNPYDPHLNKIIQDISAELNIPVKKGIYVAVMGPNLETKAEYRYLRLIGADMVGMSTVPEVIVANHIGLSCAAISVITDECNPDNLLPVNIQEILEIAGKSDNTLGILLKKVIERIA